MSILKKGVTWSFILCPIVYMISVNVWGSTGRDIFIISAIPIFIIGMIGAITWQLFYKNIEWLIEVASFFVNWFFVTYFISLLTRRW
jgi:hypothetical protein